MAQQIAIIAPTGPSFSRMMRQTFRALVRDLFNPYRPEQHYMRGPGPKWRAKYGAGRSF